MATTYPDLPSALRAARQGAGLRIDDLAAELGLSRGAVGHYESGQAVPRAGTLGKIAAITKVFLTANPDGTWGCEPAAEKAGDGD